MAFNNCRICATPLTGRQRKFCAAHSSQASILWKREQRRKWAAAGDPYWLSDWKHKSSAERRTYFREYMQKYREKRKEDVRNGKQRLTCGIESVGRETVRARGSVEPASVAVR